ncbi:FAD-dependent oxidoreductase [Actinomadura hibisca]|uniref:FAD-dependent oxidoreductase n=1 Tax=Actinomadura hibisca TaxID=68565 RepID=UPI0008318B98|nr:NAD(P)/FAD-dependent oxidoreductase [Actinomadura hibisca]
MASVAIIGAGPGGMSAALALHRAGVRVSLSEGRSTTGAAGSGLSLSAPPMLVLRRLGVDVEGLGAPARLAFCRHDGRPRAAFPALPDIERDVGSAFFGMLRPDLYERMAAALPAGILRTGRRCVGLEQDGERVRARFSDGGQVTADVLVGADGIGSTVRRVLHGPGRIDYHGFVCWQGYCELEGPNREVGRICHDRDTQASWTPILHRGRPYWQWWVLEPWPKGVPFSGDATRHLSRRLTAWTDPLPALVAATRPDRILRREVVDRPRLRTWSAGRVTLLGDAAHATSPYAAYGAGMAIEDGYHLAAQLTGRDLSDPVQVRAGLAAYERQRAARTARTAAFARRLGRAFHSPNRPWQHLRDLLLDHTTIPERLLVAGYTRTLREEVRLVTGPGRGDPP